MSTHSIICHICGYENTPETPLCIRCQAVLNVATRNVAPPPELDDTPKWGSKTARALFLHVHGSNESLSITLNDNVDIVIGRYDTINDQYPDIDLTSFDAENKGVSRRHSKFIYYNQVLRLEDLGSSNGTYINAQKLIPNQARLVRDGDEIRFGHIVATVQFGERDLDDL